VNQYFRYLRLMRMVAEKLSDCLRRIYMCYWSKSPSECPVCVNQSDPEVEKVELSRDI
jgi:hypothetical protein